MFNHCFFERSSKSSLSIKLLMICLYFLLALYLYSSVYPISSERALHCVKSVRIRIYSGPHFFPHSYRIRTRITPNTDNFYFVSLRIQSECEKIRTLFTQCWKVRKPPNDIVNNKVKFNPAFECPSFLTRRLTEGTTEHIAFNKNLRTR